MTQFREEEVMGKKPGTVLQGKKCNPGVNNLCEIPSKNEKYLR